MFAAVYGWGPEKVGHLTSLQFESYQAFAYEYLAKQEASGALAGALGGGKQSQPQKQSVPSADSTDAFAEAAQRLKKRLGGTESEKMKIPIDKVWEEVKRGN